MTSAPVPDKVKPPLGRIGCGPSEGKQFQISLADKLKKNKTFGNGGLSRAAFHLGLSRVLGAFYVINKPRSGPFWTYIAGISCIQPCKVRMSDKNETVLCLSHPHITHFPSHSISYPLWTLAEG
eukprot:1393915-Amorphochlora_amoeboformis.AAC.1